MTYTLDSQKILGYLLNDASPQGVAKSRFFRLHGFSRAHWEVLRDALLQHPVTAKLENIDPTSTYGNKWIYHCNTNGPK